MWIWMAVASALFLGLYDVAKKQALRRNDVLWILLCSTALTSLFLCPFLKAAPTEDFLWILLKAALVALSWICGLKAMELLPLTTASTLKASRPMFVVVLSVLLLGERLSLPQVLGVVLVVAGLFLLSDTSRRDEGISPGSAGFLWMALSIAAGVSSALLDKVVMRWMDPLWVQSWCNVFITAIVGCVLLVKTLLRPGTVRKLRMDWTLLAIALLITVADALYFFSLKTEGSMLSVVSVLRRLSVLVTFCCGAVMWKEKNVKRKTLCLAVLLLGVVLLVIGTIK